MEELLLNFSRTCSQAREKITAVSEIIENGIVPDDCTLREMEEMITAVRESHDAVKNWYTSETGRDLSSDVPVADIKMLYNQYLDECLKKHIQELCTTVELFLSVKSDKEEYTDALRPNREKSRVKLELLKQEDDTVDVGVEEFFLSLLEADRSQLFEQSVMDKLDENFSDVVQAGLFKGKYYVGDEPVQDPEPVKEEQEEAEPVENVLEEEIFANEPVAEESVQESVEENVCQEECRCEECVPTECEETATEEVVADEPAEEQTEDPAEEPVAEEFVQESVEENVCQEECRCEEDSSLENGETVTEEPESESAEESFSEEVQEEQESAEEPSSEEVAEDEEIIEFDEPEAETALDYVAPAREGEQSPFQESDIVKSGHWYTEAVSDESLSFEEETEGTEIKEESSEDPLTHKVIFNAEPGTIDGSNQIEMTVADGALVNQPDSFIYCDGLDFVYWYNEDESEPFSFPAYITSDTVFHSKWV